MNEVEFNATALGRLLVADHLCHEGLPHRGIQRGAGTGQEGEHTHMPESDDSCDRENSQHQRKHSPYTKGNFEFERVVVGWRTSYPVLDLRLKK